MTDETSVHETINIFPTYSIEDQNVEIPENFEFIQEESVKEFGKYNQ